MAITFADLVGEGGDADRGRRILAVARSIAPGLDLLVDEPRLEAIAILKGVLSESLARGARHVASQGVGTARVAYRTVESWFMPDDRSALRALVAASGVPGAPVGSFPDTDAAVASLWPEGGY